MVIWSADAVLCCDVGGGCVCAMTTMLAAATIAPHVPAQVLFVIIPPRGGPLQPSDRCPGARLMRECAHGLRTQEGVARTPQRWTAEVAAVVVAAVAG